MNKNLFLASPKNSDIYHIFNLINFNISLCNKLRLRINYIPDKLDFIQKKDMLDQDLLDILCPECKKQGELEL